MSSPLTALRHNGDSRIVFFYGDGLVAELNFAELIRNSAGPVVEPLTNETVFAQAYIDHGALTWPTGYDVSPEVLRFWCEQGRICSREETDAHFATTKLNV